MQDFVNRVAKAMTGEMNPAHQDKALRGGLYGMALGGGQSFVWQGMHVDERMALGEWAKSFKRDEREFEPFGSRVEWDGFCAALATVRDLNEPITDRASLLRWGEAIEARQRPHAKRMGWVEAQNEP